MVKMQMKMSQQLIMTPQLQQAIKLLQLSRAELEELIEQTLIENPVLEEGMDMDTFPSKVEESQESSETEETPEVVTDTDEFETAREKVLAKSASASSRVLAGNSLSRSSFLAFLALVVLVHPPMF